MFLFLADAVQRNEALLAACSGHRPQGKKLLTAGRSDPAVPRPCQHRPTATRQQGHSCPLLGGMPGPSPVLGAVGAQPGRGCRHTGSATRSPSAERSGWETQSMRTGTAGAWGSYFCCLAEGFCVALLLLQKQIWAAELTEQISER